MIWKMLAVSGLVPAAVFAQLQLFQFDGTVERPVGALFDVGSAATGDTLESRFRVRNTGSAAITVQTISVAGAGFKLSAQPALPYILAPQNAVDFRVAFSPTTTGSFSANVAVNTLSAMLTGRGVPTTLVLFEQSPLSSGMIAGFGQAEIGSNITKTFTISNPNASALDVNSISVTGPGFRGPVGIAAPLQLAPGASASFQVVFEPQQPMPAQGTLSIDQRSFVLVALGTEPPLPKATLVMTGGALSSAQQSKISIVLASASKVNGAGTLTLDFRPNPGLPDDPAVQFLSGPRRAASFAVKPGDTQYDFAFQTGTTAGTIVFTVKTTNSADQFTVPIAPATVSIDNAMGSRRVNDLDISLSGFDNTHSISQLSFTFYDKGGRVLQPGVLRVDAAPEFKRYFDSGQAGGMFLMRATFPVTGDASQIAGADVQVANSAGVANTQRITF